MTSPESKQNDHLLRCIHDAVKRIGLLDDQADILRETVEAAHAGFGAPAVLCLRGTNISALESTSADYRPVAARGADIRDWPPIAAPDLAATCIVRRGRALSASDLSTHVPGQYSRYSFAPLDLMGLPVGLLAVGKEVDELRSTELELLCALASVSAVAVGRTREHQSALEEQRRTARLSRYFSPQVARLLSQEPSYGAGVRRDATVLFCDIRGFTAFCAARSPEEVFRYLTAYYEQAVASVLAHGGMVDKLLGDGILAVFGAPLESDRHALDAIACAHDLQRRCHELLFDGARTRIGIGIASGSILLGDVGGAGFLDFTVLGSPVNLASRIEAMTRTLGRSILVSDATRQLAGGASFESLGEHAIRGLDEPVELWQPSPPE